MNENLPSTRSIAVWLLLATGLLSPVLGRGEDRYVTQLAALNPVAHWQLDERGGRVAADSAGGLHAWYRGPISFGHDGALAGGANSAVGFDGAKSYVRVAHDDAMLLDRGAVVFWVNPDSVTTSQGLLSKDASGFGSGGHLTIWIEGGVLRARLQSAAKSYEIFAKGIAARRWQHVVCSFGDKGLRLFMDGKLAAAHEYSGGLGASSGGEGNREPLVLGADAKISKSGQVGPLQQYFRGGLDQVALLGEEPSDEQVVELFDAAKPCYRSLAEAYTLNNPLAWWRLDEPQSATTAIDQVGCFHGTYRVRGEKRFDGDDYVDVGRLDVKGRELTILACVCPKSFSVHDARVISKAVGTALEDHFWMLSTVRDGDAVRLRFRVHTNRGAKELIGNCGKLQAGKCTLVAAVYDGCKMRLYQNNKLVGETKHCGELKTKTCCHVWIGDNPPKAGSRPFRGVIRDVALFDHALTHDDIASISLAKCPPPQKPVAPQPPCPAPVEEKQIVCRLEYCLNCGCCHWRKYLMISGPDGVRYERIVSP